MKPYRLFLSLSRGKQIAIAVFAAHLVAIFALICHHLATHRFKSAKPIVVRMQRPLPLKAPPLAASPSAQNKSEKLAPQAHSPSIAPAKPAAQMQKKVASVAKKGSPLPSKKEPLLKEIADGLEALSSTAKPKQTRAPLSLPAQIQPKTEPLQVQEANETFSYAEHLIAYLQSTLDLPEYGEVKLKLEIDRFGNLIDCKILEAKNNKNSEFLKNRLPELSFPCLNDFGILDATQTFTITFRNVEIH